MTTDETGKSTEKEGGKDVEVEVIVEPDVPGDDPRQGDRGIDVRGPAQSVPLARRFTTFKVDMCTRFVWNCLAAPRHFGLDHAHEAWERAKNRHTDMNAPAGAPVYWGGGKFGHIALSVGGGRVRSTDWPDKGVVGEVSIERLTRAWNKPYRGWSSDFAGVPIPGLGAGASTAATGAAGTGGAAIDDEAIRPGKRNAAVRRFNKALWNSMPADYRAAHQKAWMGEAADFYGPVAQQVCFDKYAMLNKKDPKKWPLPTKPVWPGPGLLRHLGLRPD
jgi:hypothetical protein